MEHRIPVAYLVTAHRHNVQVAARHAGNRNDAERIANRMRSVPGTTVEITEVPDPAETDLTTFSRELSESRGWRTEPAAEGAQ